MNTVKDSGDKRKGKNPALRSSGASRAESAVFAMLGLVGFVSVAIALISSSIPAGSHEDPFGNLAKAPVIRYFRSGQLLADMRTAAAMVHYFFESEPAPLTNVAIQPPPPTQNLAMPTNRSIIEPKA